MQTVKTFGVYLFFIMIFKMNASAQTFENTDKAKTYFYNLDDSFNIAMSKNDSAFFTNIFAESFINETPYGNLNNKQEEIHGLVGLAPVRVERVPPKFDIFTYSGEVATLSVVKKLTMKDASVLYVRRTIVHQLINSKWKIVSGQGTIVKPEVVDEFQRKNNDVIDGD